MSSRIVVDARDRRDGRRRPRAPDGAARRRPRTIVASVVVAVAGARRSDPSARDRPALGSARASGRRRGVARRDGASRRSRRPADRDRGPLGPWRFVWRPACSSHALAAAVRRRARGHRLAALDAMAHPRRDARPSAGRSRARCDAGSPARCRGSPAPPAAPALLPMMDDVGRQPVVEHDDGVHARRAERIVADVVPVARRDRRSRRRQRAPSRRSRRPSTSRPRRDPTCSPASRPSRTCSPSPSGRSGTSSPRASDDPRPAVRTSRSTVRRRTGASSSPRSGRHTRP